MHPTYVSDRPGQCPICKMDLVPMQPAAAAGGERKILYYRSPMDPSIRSDAPRKDAMGMDFVPVYEDEATSPVVAGRAMVALSPERRQLLGVRSEAVTRRHLDRTIRTVGRVAMDERRLHHVHTKYEAYVEKLYVNFIGQMVRKGDHLAALYSPELVATQQEYLLAYRAQQRLAAERHRLGRQGGHRPPRGGAAAAPVLGRGPGRHRRARAHGAGPAHRRPARRAARLRPAEERGARHARDARRHPLRHRRPVARCGSSPTSTSPTWPRSSWAWPRR